MTIDDTIELGSGGPLLKKNGDALEIRTSDDTDFATIRGAMTAGPNDLTPLGNILFSQPWVTVAAGATVNVATYTMYVVTDTAGALVTFLFPSAPADGSPVLIKLLGAKIAVPVQLTAGAGDAIEDPQTAGTFSAVAGSVSMSVAGSMAAFKYLASTQQWIEFL